MRLISPDSRIRQWSDATTGLTITTVDRWDVVESGFSGRVTGDPARIEAQLLSVRHVTYIASDRGEWQDLYIRRLDKGNHPTKLTQEWQCHRLFAETSNHH